MNGHALQLPVLCLRTGFPLISTDPSPAYGLKLQFWYPQRGVTSGEKNPFDIKLKGYQWKEINISEWWKQEVESLRKVSARLVTERNPLRKRILLWERSFIFLLGGFPPPQQSSGQFTGWKCFEIDFPHYRGKHKLDRGRSDLVLPLHRGEVFLTN